MEWAQNQSLTLMHGFCIVDRAAGKQSISKWSWESFAELFSVDAETGLKFREPYAECIGSLPTFECLCK